MPQVDEQTRGGAGASTEVIQTVKGPIDPSELGPTTMHEHILTSDADVLRERVLAVRPNHPDDILDAPTALEHRGRLDLDFVAQRANLRFNDDELVAGELEDLASAGCRSVLEVSPIGVRVAPERIAAAAEKAGIHVVLSTGLYVADTWPEEYRDWSVEQLTELFERELREGIGDSGIKPGHIKCAVGDLGAGEERALLAAAEVAGRTGAAITVHPGMYGISADGRRIARILLDAGVDPTRLVIAHGDAFIVEGDLRRRLGDPSSLRLSLDYHRELLDQGVNISFDCFGHRWALPALGFVMENDWERLAAVCALVREGYGDRLLLGTDVFSPMLTRRLGGFGYAHLWATMIPLLRELGGVSDWDIRQMTVESPRRLLTLPQAL